MKTYRFKTLVKAQQWLKDGDHPEVRKYQHLGSKDTLICVLCAKSLVEHGWHEGEDLLVCPGSWVVYHHPELAPKVMSDAFFRDYYEEVPIKDAFANLQWVPAHGSSNIVRFAYEESNDRLAIDFGGSGIYVYEDVPKAVFEEMQMAESYGRFFHKYVKNTFKFEKVAINESK